MNAQAARKLEHEDMYPSRVYAEPRILERKDPTVYQEYKGKSGLPISEAQIESYERNGFLVLESFFSDEEVAALRRELDKQRKDAAANRATSKEVIIEPDSEEVRSLFRIHQLGEIFPLVARDERILNIVNFLLGSETYIHQSRANLKPGFRGKEFYWHSDFETWHVEDGMPRMRAISCSVTLTDNFEQNGPLMLVPGSHKQYVSCVGATPENHYEASLRRQEFGVPDDESLAKLVDEGGLVTATGKAGSIVLFECNVMHGSNSNISPSPRSNLFMVYNSVENAIVEPFGDIAPRPEHIATREDFSPLKPVPQPDYAALVKHS